MAQVTVIPGAGPAQGARPRRWSLPRLVTAVGAAIIRGLERTQQRRALQRLDDRLLKDIGLSRADVAGESGKPFWRG